MSSSAPRLQPEPAPGSQPEAAPFLYAEAQAAGAGASGLTPEQAAEERSRRQQAEAFARGREAGEQQIRASVETSLSRNRDQILQALAEFGRERAAYYRRVEGEVVQLALAVARKILHREAQIDPHLLAGVVRVTLDKLDAGTKVDLCVHRPRNGRVAPLFACQTEGASVPEVHEDAALAAGECRIETSLGATEAGLEAQLKEIETGLLDLLAERPPLTGQTVPAKHRLPNPPHPNSTLHRPHADDRAASLYLLLASR